MKPIILFLILISLSYADSFGSYIMSGSTGSTPEYPMGIFPDDSSTYWKRPYKVEFTSKFDGRTDTYTIAFPHNFDPSKTYPIWFKFSPYYGSGTNIDYPTFAWNLCDKQDVIFVGAHLRGPDGWFGDNTKLDSLDQANISKDLVELTNQITSLFNISYVASFGASMGGYSSLRFLTHLPQEYVGATVPSCPALYFRPWCADGSDSISTKVSEGFFNGVFVAILHGTEDGTVPVSVSENLTALVPDTEWWNFIPVPEKDHQSFFVTGTDDGFPNSEQWGISPIVPDIWNQIEQWEQAHPEKSETIINPSDFGWTSSDEWYLPENIRNASTKGTTSVQSINSQSINSQSISSHAVHLVGRNLRISSLEQGSTIELFDLRGRQILNQQLNITETVSLAEIQSGVYILKLTNSISPIKSQNSTHKITLY